MEKQKQFGRNGLRSPEYGHLGVYYLCTGPDPEGLWPGERVIIIIYDQDNNIVRRLEQVSSYGQDTIVDTDQNGNQTPLATLKTLETADWFKTNVQKWAIIHGVLQH